MNEKILGIWDGHDAGAALVEDDQIIFAINEERLSHRKLDVGFPYRSIETILEQTGLSPNEIGTVSCSTADFAKTLTRSVPTLKEEYYLIRRKKKRPGPLTAVKKKVKYKLTELPPTAPARMISKRILARELAGLGFSDPKIDMVDHHAAHAAAAAFCSGFSDCLVLTIDGIGDGKSGSIWDFADGKLARIANLSGTASLGIFFEHVTNLLNMRELEDEGKVMALANFAYPIPDDENPLLDFLSIDGMQIKARHSSLQLYNKLAKVLWNYPSEQFAYMAQRTLELKVVELVRNALRKTGRDRIAYAGGVASNVKVNMLIRELPEGVKLTQKVNDMDTVTASILEVESVDNTVSFNLDQAVRPLSASRPATDRFFRG